MKESYREASGFCRCKHHCSSHAGTNMMGRCAFFEFEDCRCNGFVAAKPEIPSDINPKYEAMMADPS